VSSVVPAVAIAAACATVLGLAGCERDSPPSPVTPNTKPSPPALLPVGTQLAVVSGDDSAPVASAEVRIAGRVYRSDAAGQVVLVEAAEEGSLLEAEHGEFLPRRLQIREAGDGQVVLWPARVRRIRVDEDYTRKLVYTAWYESLRDQPRPLKRLPRSARRVSLVPDARIRAMPESMAAIRDSARQMEAAMAGALAFSVEEQPRGDVVMEMVIDPQGPCPLSACVTLTQQGSEIRAARIIFGREDVLGLRKPSVILHEMGHAFGLEHSLDPADVMYQGSYPWGLVDFTDAEWLTIRMVLRRRAGNTWPDNDTPTAADRAEVRTVLVRCQ
jgi:hypothetical protein